MWQSKISPGKPLPSRADIDFYDVTEWLGRIFIAELEHDPFNLRFSLWGTTLSDWWGFDYTNKHLGEGSSDPNSWSDELQYFAAMHREPCIGVASGLLTLHERSFIKVMSLDFPLSTGSEVTHVLSFHTKIETSQTVSDILPICGTDAFTPFVPKTN